MPSEFLRKHLRAWADVAYGARLGLLIGVAVGVLTWSPRVPAPTQQAKPAAVVRAADFGIERPSPQVRQLADWIADSGDNAGDDFVIIDKQFAILHLFDASARLRASTAVLLGSAIGDDSVPGIGTRPIAQVLPEERTSPAGRFVAERGRNTHGEDVIWIDYHNAVSMHRVRATVAAERRLERLATATADDNRISYGCINVPTAFYDRYIQPAFARQHALVYVLPEVKSLHQVFDSFTVAAAR